MEPVPVTLTIAGSDSGGGAGIQADLKTFTALGCFGTSAITCLTAQNPDGVTGIEPVSPEMVAGQVRAVCAGFPVAAAKTGMLFSAPLIRAVAGVLREVEVPRLVVDPVMVATSGARLLQEDAVEALCEDLVPLAMLLTPNAPEAEVLAGCGPVVTREDQRRAAASIAARYGTVCVVKGGHVRRPAGRATMVNVLATGAEILEIDAPAVDALSTHGTGCTFAAAVAAGLARGRTVEDAVRGAGDYVAASLAAARPAGRHHVMMPVRP